MIEINKIQEKNIKKSYMHLKFWILKTGFNKITKKLTKKILVDNR